MKKIFFLIFYILSIKSYSQINSNIYYEYIFDAEDKIMANEYNDAILLYNKAFQINQLSSLSTANYIKILKLNPNLYSKYFDTFVKCSLKYAIKSELFNGDSLINKNNLCGNFKKEIDFCFKQDREVRVNAMKYVKQADMYSIEPYKTQIRNVDKHNYNKICELILIDSNKKCSNYAMKKHSLIWHCLALNSDSFRYKLDELITLLCKKGFIDNIILSNLIAECYNSSTLHNPKDEYKINGDIVKTKNYLIYAKLSKNEIDRINKIRASYSLESYEKFLYKIIWQSKQDKYKFYILPQWEFSNIQEEKDFVNKISDSEKNIIVELNVR